MDLHSKTVNSKSRRNASMIQTTLLNKATGVEVVGADSGAAGGGDFAVEVAVDSGVAVEDGGEDFIRIKRWWEVV
jgi:hypothetical protein